jgi:hypothetical protein
LGLILANNFNFMAKTVKNAKKDKSTWEIPQLANLYHAFVSFGISRTIAPALLAHVMSECNPSSTGFKIRNYTSITYTKHIIVGYKSDFEKKYRSPKTGQLEGTGSFFAGFQTDEDFVLAYCDLIVRKYHIVASDSPEQFIDKIIAGGWIDVTAGHDNAALYKTSFERSYNEITSLLQNNKI